MQFYDVKQIFSVVFMENQNDETRTPNAKGQLDLEGCTLVKQGSSYLQSMTLDVNSPKQQRAIFFISYLRPKWRRNRPCVPCSDSITSMARGGGWWCKLLCNITGLEHSNEIIILYGSACKHCNLGSGFIHNHFALLLTNIFRTDGLLHDQSQLRCGLHQVCFNSPFSTTLSNVCAIFSVQMAKT